MERKKVATITVDGDKWERFKKIAKLKNRTASQLIRDWINDYLKQNSQLILEDVKPKKE